MTTKNSFLETTWKQTSQNNNSDVFDIAQKNSVSITLAELLLSRKVDSIKSFLSSKLKDNLSVTKIEKLSNIDKSKIFFEQIKETKKVNIDMTLTSPNCPVAESLPKMVKDNILKLEGVDDVDLNLVWDPPWTKDKMSEAAKLELNL